MTTPKPSTLRFPLAAAAALLACSSSTLAPPPHDAQADVPSTLGAPQGTCPGSPGSSNAPDLHRASAVTCAPSATPSLDQCLTDADCAGGGACVCAGTFYGGNALHGNVCVSGNCRLDSDCGPAGYCSPSIGRCGAYDGYYCHTPQDTCRDSIQDCGGCGNSCSYMPTVGGFVCVSNVCNG